MLNTSKALQLAQWLSPHIPEEFDGEILDFIGTIVSSIKGSDDPETFARSVMLMGDLSVDEINEMEIFDIISQFADGLQENKVLSLIEFYQWLMK